MEERKREEKENIKENKGKRILQLFLTFLKIGAFTFGGGYAMIPFIEEEVVERKKWLSADDLLEAVAIAESTPGPIAINTATYVGARVAGPAGSAAATFGVVLPSLVIIYIISLFLEAFVKIKPVAYAFYGIRAAVLALIIKAVFTLGKKTKKSIFSAVMISAAFIVVAFLRVNAFYVIIGAAIAGIIYSLISEKKAGERKE